MRLRSPGAADREQMWVKNARRGARRSTVSMDRSTVECVGCGLWRSASRNSTSRPRNSSMDSVGNVAVIGEISRAAEAKAVNRTRGRAAAASARTPGRTARTTRRSRIWVRVGAPTIAAPRRRRCTGSSAGWRSWCLPTRRSGSARFCRKLNGRTSSSPMMWSACECVNSTASSRSILRAQNLRAEVRRGVDHDIAVRRIAAAPTDAAGCRADREDEHTAQWQPGVGTPTLVPDPSTVIFNGPDAPIQLFLLSSTACTKRKRNSVSEFSSSRCSSSVRFPLVFSCSMPSRSMLWRARPKSGFGRSFPGRSVPARAAVPPGCAETAPGIRTRRAAAECARGLLTRRPPLAACWRFRLRSFDPNILSRLVSARTSAANPVLN